MLTAHLCSQSGQVSSMSHTTVSSGHSEGRSPSLPDVTSLVMIYDIASHRSSQHLVLSTAVVPTTSTITKHESFSNLKHMACLEMAMCKNTSKIHLQLSQTPHHLSWIFPKEVFCLQRTLLQIASATRYAYCSAFVFYDRTCRHFHLASYVLLTVIRALLPRGVLKDRTKWKPTRCLTAHTLTMALKK